MTKEKEEAGKKSTKNTKGSEKSKPFFTDERIKFITGILITGFAFYLLLACISYLLWWKTDQSLPTSDVLSGPDIEVKNWSGKSGHFLAEMIIRYGFGFGAFFIPLIFGTIGLYLLRFPKIRPISLILKFTFAAIIISLMLGFVFGKSNVYLGSGPGGAQGYMVARWMNAFMGKIGTGVLISVIGVSYLIFALKVKPESFGIKIPSFLRLKKSQQLNEQFNEEGNEEESDSLINEEAEIQEPVNDDKPVEFVVRNTNSQIEEDDSGDVIPEVFPRRSIIRDFENDNTEKGFEEEVPIDIIRPETEGNLTEHEVDRIMENYDPRLDLSHYKFPPVSILKEHKSESAFDNTEVRQ
jgi:S-DNA-T family DNA segregation ATPase FtsK/SpoIIIE